MGYDLHIIRRKHWFDEGNNITSEEWLDIIKNDSELQLKTEYGPFFAVWNGKSTLQDPWLNWSHGQIQTKNPDDALIDKMVSIANKLHAVVQGDDGELYQSHLDAHRTRNESRIFTNRHTPLKILGLIIIFSVCVFLFSSLSNEYLNLTISIFIGVSSASVITLIWGFIWFNKRKFVTKIITKDYHSTGEILGADQMKYNYGLTISKYKPDHLNPEKVPEQFRDLIPLAQKWGIGDDVIRADLHNTASDEDKESLKESLNGRTNAINQWLDSYGNSKMSVQARAFMYMLLGLDEMGIYVDPASGFYK